MRRKPAAHSVPARTPLTSDTMLLISKPNLVYRRCKSASIAATPSSIKKMKAVLGPMIEERLEKDAHHGKDWEGKPVRIASKLQSA